MWRWGGGTPLYARPCQPCASQQGSACMTKSTCCLTLVACYINKIASLLYMHQDACSIYQTCMTSGGHQTQNEQHLLFVPEHLIQGCMFPCISVSNESSPLVQCSFVARNKHMIPCKQNTDCMLELLPSQMKKAVVIPFHYILTAQHQTCLHITQTEVAAATCIC